MSSRIVSDRLVVAVRASCGRAAPRPSSRAIASGLGVACRAGRCTPSRSSRVAQKTKLCSLAEAPSWPWLDLAAAAEQAVAVERRARGAPRSSRDGDVAGEARRASCCRRSRRRPVRRARRVRERAARTAARRVQVARHRVPALDAQRSCSVRVRRDLLDRERRARRPRPSCRRGSCRRARSNASSRMSSIALGQVALARDREVPRAVEVVAVDAGLGERAEDATRSARGAPRRPCWWSGRGRGRRGSRAGAASVLPSSSLRLRSATM